MEKWIFTGFAIAGGLLAAPVAFRLAAEGDGGVAALLVLTVLAGALGLTALLSLLLKALSGWRRPRGR